MRRSGPQMEATLSEEDDLGRPRRERGRDLGAGCGALSSAGMTFAADPTSLPFLLTLITFIIIIIRLFQLLFISIIIISIIIIIITISLFQLLFISIIIILIIMELVNR